MGQRREAVMDGLLKIDICNRLPYGVKALAQLCPIPSIVTGIYPDGKYFLGDSREKRQNNIARKLRLLIFNRAR